MDYACTALDVMNAVLVSEVWLCLHGYTKFEAAFWIYYICHIFCENACIVTIL